MRSWPLLRRVARQVTTHRSRTSCRALSSYLPTETRKRRKRFLCAETTPIQREFATDFSSNVQTGDQNSYEKAISELPDGAQIHLDFFGEPVTFQGISRADKIPNAVASLDGFIIGVASKGKAFTGGGEEEGLGVQAAHSAALAWAELLRHASVWNRTGKTAPMLSYVAVAPLLAQTGVGYLEYIDNLLGQVESGVEGLPPIQMLKLAEEAAKMKIF